MMTMKMTARGVTVTYTNTYLGMLEQGGICNRKVLVPWGCVPGLTPGADLDLDGATEGETLRDWCRNLATGRWTGLLPIRVLRRGERIR